MIIRRIRAELRAMWHERLVNRELVKRQGEHIAEMERDATAALERERVLQNECARILAVKDGLRNCYHELQVDLEAAQRERDNYRDAYSYAVEAMATVGNVLTADAREHEPRALRVDNPYRDTLRRVWALVSELRRERGELQAEVERLRNRDLEPAPPGWFADAIARARYHDLASKLLNECRADDSNGDQGTAVAFRWETLHQSVAGAMAGAAARESDHELLASCVSWLAWRGAFARAAGQPEQALANAIRERVPCTCHGDYESDDCLYHGAQSERGKLPQEEVSGG